MKTEDCFYQFVVLVFKCGGRSFGKQPENGCLFLRLFSDLAALVWPRSDCLTDWLLTLKPHSSCWSESWFNQTKDAFFSPSREEEGVGLTNSFWTRIFIGDFWESCLVSLQRKLFPETGTKTMKYQKIQTDVLSVALLLGFLFFFLFATAMPKEGATKANRQQRMHNEHQHGRLRTTLKFYIIKWT